MAFEFISIMDIVGTIAFAASGAIIAIRKGMDLFGVMILALVTATGGGFIRDLTIGFTPPSVFRNPIFMILAFVTAIVVFVVTAWFQHKPMHARLIFLYEKIMLITDSLGLAAFTVEGVYVGHQMLENSSVFLMVFLGVVTGVGGGVIRDIFATEKPYVFVRHIYAVAAVVGALVTAVGFRFVSVSTALLVGFSVILVIRYLAARFKLNLPKIDLGIR